MTLTGESGISAQSSNNPPDTQRKARPVFVMGCHRSGTNLLYDTLLSAGGFAVYRGYIPIYKILIPRFGSLENPGNRKKIVDTWMQSKGFARAGVEAGPLSSKLLAQGRTGGDFMRIVMDEVAQSQGVQRWAVYDPDSVLHVPRIKRDLPDALFVHIIRDGRDIAVSLKKMGEFRPFPWSHKSRGLQETALYWDWMVHKGRHYGHQIPGDYLEIHYEDLVNQTRSTLGRLGQFIDHDLDYDRIQNAGLGRLRESNSSFLREGTDSKNPVQRWKEKLSPRQLEDLEALIGATLQEFGYSLAVEPSQQRPDLLWKSLASIYPRLLSTKLWLKLNTPAGRLASLSSLELNSVATDGE